MSHLNAKGIASPINGIRFSLLQGVQGCHDHHLGGVHLSQHRHIVCTKILEEIGLGWSRAQGDYTHATFAVFRPQRQAE